MTPGLAEAPKNAGLEAALGLIRARAAGGGRLLIALAGPPGVGKSTLSEPLREALGQDAAIVPMDGFHFDDSVLAERGFSARKGAPETFDLEGLAATLGRLRAGGDVAVPVFDRAMELARAGGRIVPASARFIIVEGNYLLLDRPPWDGLHELFDIRLFIDAPLAELERRLVARWLGFGFDIGEARRKAEGNDLPNARLVLAHRSPADLTLISGGLTVSGAGGMASA